MMCLIRLYAATPLFKSCFSNAIFAGFRWSPQNAGKIPLFKIRGFRFYPGQENYNFRCRVYNFLSVVNRTSEMVKYKSQC